LRAQSAHAERKLFVLLDLEII